jgi:hypothetical protein
VGSYKRSTDEIGNGKMGEMEEMEEMEEMGEFSVIWNPKKR